jgi:hypothetical protein
MLFSNILGPPPFSEVFGESPRRQNTLDLMMDVRRRIADHRVQLTTDAYIFYRKAAEESFAGDADFAQLTKLFEDYGQFGNERYSPGRITEVISKIRSGNPTRNTSLPATSSGRT